jgi:diaminopimelate decarboxylase
MATVSQQDTRFRLSEEQALELVEAYGTPLYVVDEVGFRCRIGAYMAAATAAYADSRVTFASKANSSLALLAIAADEGCYIDVASEGELRAALLAGVPASNCILHGNNKQAAELAFAFEAGVGEIVVDNFGEIELISELARTDEPASKIVGEVLGVDVGAPRTKLHCPKLALRLAPGVDPVTHAKISTGQADTKFGFNISDGAAEKAVARCMELGLPLVGIHCHVGSQLLDPQAQRDGAEALAEFAVRMKRELGFTTKVLNAGGGLGVRYTDGDQPTPVEEYCKMIAQSVVSALQGSGLKPTLIQEPGRSLIAESGVTLYTVGVVKTVPTAVGATRTYVCVDGGLSDNPRPALYGSRYTVERVARSADPDGEVVELNGDRTRTVTVSGRHCETDLLFPDIELPADVRAGDLLQVLCTGAYNSTMASNYNRFRRPPCALLRKDGSHCLIQRPETWDEMFEREIIPAGLVRG